ncbi:MAG: RagB/SusD family nutrient uptake outer membrane protein [Alistipes sp.]
MKRYILSSLFAVILLFASSCNDYLDMTPTNSNSDKMIYANAEYTGLAINRFYHFFDVMGQFDTGQSSVGLTEGMTETLKYGCTTLNAHMWFANGVAYGTEVTDAHSVAYFLGQWDNLYSYISEVNVALSNIEKYGTYDAKQKTVYIGECRLLRGFLYFELLKRHKQCVLRTENLEVDYQNNIPLSSETDCWEFVYQDMKFAAANLPDKSADGRLTNGAAYGLLSRAMLYAERWQDAFDAAKSVIDLNLYDLTDDYQTAWSKTRVDGNTESIIEYEYNFNGVTHSFDNNFTPGGDAGTVQSGLGTPTQEMVEQYESKTGTKIDWSMWHTANATTQTPPYDQLEPRFAATIIYNGCTWKGRTMNTTIEGGKDGYIAWREKPQTGGKTTTGYYLRKLVNENHDLTVNSKSTQPWIALRYAEVLLNYAEAACHLNKATEAKWALNDKIRHRVSLPAKGSSGEALLAAVRQERRIELAYEGQLYWDMRRWKLADKEYSGKRVHGFRIEKIAGELVYNYVDCDGQDRFFSPKLYQIALPTSEMDNNTAVHQFDVWK